MKKDNQLNNNIKDLIDRYSKIDIISNIERNYSAENIKHISLDLIDDNRYLKDVPIPDEELFVLVKSIRENNLYSPLVVRNIENNRFELILGRKRYMAAVQIGFQQVPAIINNLTDEEVLFTLLADTKDRKNVSAYEMSVILTKLKNDFHCSNKILAEFLGQSESQISNFIALNKLPKYILNDLAENKISYGHARCLAYLKNEDDINYVYQLIKEDNLSVRATEELIANNLEKAENSKVFVLNNHINVKYSNEKEKEELLSLISNYFENKDKNI